MRRKATREPDPNSARDWRILAGQESPARDSRVARWRVFRRWFQTLFMLSGLAASAVILYLAWQEIGLSTEESPYSGAMVRFETNEALDRDWFLEYTGLARGERLSIFQIKEKLEKLGQIEEVSLNRLPGGGLEVRVRERIPVARLEGVLPNGTRVVRVVAADGVIYQGINYSSMVFSNLPELLGATVRRHAGGNYDMVPGMEVASGLLLYARERHQALYQEWESISVRDFARGDANAPGAVIRVRLRQVSQQADLSRLRDVIFSAKDYMNEFLNFYSQPWFLDSIMARLRQADRTRFPLFDLYLYLENKTDPNNVFKEPRVIPVTGPG